MNFDAVLRLRGWMVFTLLFAGALLGFGSVSLSGFPRLAGPAPLPSVRGGRRTVRGRSPVLPDQSLHRTRLRYAPARR